MTAREYLEQARFLDTRIKSKVNQIQDLEDLATSTSTVLSDMPKNPIPSTSRMADVVCKIIDLQTELKQDMNKLLDLKKEILSTVKCVLNVEHQTVLEKRYLCYESWEQIAVDLGYSSKHIFKVHNAALDDVELLLQKKCDEAKVDTKIH